MVLLICFHFVHRDCFYPVLSGLSFYIPPPPPSTCSTPPLKVCILIMIALGIGTGRLDMTAPFPWVWRYRHCFFFSSPLITLFFSSPPVLIPTSCELRSYRSMSGKPGRARKTWIGETEYIKVVPNRESVTFSSRNLSLLQMLLKPGDLSAVDTLEHPAIFCPRECYSHWRPSRLHFFKFTSVVMRFKMRWHLLTNVVFLGLCVQMKQITNGKRQLRWITCVHCFIRCK